MLNIKVNVDSLEKLQKYIDFVELMNKMKIDKEFQKFIQNKCLETVNKIASDRLPNGDLSLMYIENNKIREIDGGFVLYNDTSVETESEGYDGQFCIALAFEYGTGIVGQNNPKVGAWAYNVNQHEKGWTYFKDDTFHFTRGFAGFEIYRYTAEEIKKQLEKWVLEYKDKKGGVSE